MPGLRRCLLGVRVVLLTASGTKAFCSGADLKAGIAAEDGFDGTLEKRYHPLIRTMRAMPKPIVCRLNGLAAGAGASLALAADVIIAAETAAMAFLFVQIGLVPDAGATYHLQRLVGPMRAFELASTGRTIAARECLELGLVSQVVPEADLDAATEKLLGYYAQAPSSALAGIKALFSDEAGLNAALAREAGQQQLAGTHRNFQEGVMAFLQKRKAVFQ